MKNKKIGYAWLKEYFSIPSILVEIECFVLPIASVKKHQGKIFYPSSYNTKQNTPIEHILFALKHESLNLQCLQAIFKQPNIKKKIEQAIVLMPNGKYIRQMGFFYELLTNNHLEIKPLTSGNYINAVDKTQYYVCEAIKSNKFRINDNLVGNGDLSGLIKRNDSFINDKEIEALSIQNLSKYPIDFTSRAVRYLMSVETKSSSQIEDENISPSKKIKFMLALENINKKELNKQKLIDTLNFIKDKHYQEFEYRSQQNYLEKSGSGYGYTSIDYVTPKPDDAHLLMNDWFILRKKVLTSDMPTIAKTAVLSSSFVYIHPFMDGNGRMSRYIMQDTLHHSSAISSHTSLPLSAGILLDVPEYYEILNSISQQIMESVKFELHDNKSITVLNDTADLYRHLCFDKHSAYLSATAKLVLTELIPKEIKQLKKYDDLHEKVNAGIDLPSKDIKLITNLLIDGNGIISNKKRKGVLQHLKEGALDYTEQLYRDLFR